MALMDWARTFSLGTLANEVVFSISVYENGGLSESETGSLLAGGDLLKDILVLETQGDVPEDPRVRGALPKLNLLKTSSSIIDAWIKSEIPFPKNDDEFERELNSFIQTLEEMAEQKSKETIGIDRINLVEKLFSTLGEMALLKIHTSSLYDRT